MRIFTILLIFAVSPVAKAETITLSSDSGIHLAVKSSMHGSIEFTVDGVTYVMTIEADNGFEPPEDDPDLSEVPKAIREAAEKVDQEPGEIVELAAAYRAVAAKADADDDWETSDMAQALKDRVRQILDAPGRERWKPVSDVSNRVLSAASGKQEAIDILRKIADGLET